MSLHDDIMNIPAGRTDDTFVDNMDRYFYKEGHRDARHAAAELAIEADKTIEEMKYELERVLDWLEMGDVEDSFADPIRKLVGRPLGHPAYR